MEDRKGVGGIRLGRKRVGRGKVSEVSIIISPGRTDTRLYYQSGLELLSPVNYSQQKKMKSKSESNLATGFILLSKPNLGSSQAGFEPRSTV